MNLKKLFELQRQLDEHIEKEHPRQPGEDRLAKKILALQVELGELAQEWRGFKFWSNDQEPRTKVEVICSTCDGSGDENWPSSREYLLEGQTGLEYSKCEDCNGTGTLGYKNPLLEEYVDCLHFILSIGNEINMNEVYEDSSTKPVYLDDVIYQFMFVNQDICSLYYNRHNDDINGDIYDLIFSGFLGLGEMLGFSWEEVEEAYLRKNRENHQRQESGY
ncbi:dUTP diphosphatase [Aeribacillus pallidus]|uniref:dUTP diphosphatase n=1 Tax=Aeribacillus composti TaxID=1868734 RepID=UPI002E2099A7|nr:dUTP diphosphatase [Aeribacillus composti]MED4488187.1 dUTP diphosphatase [Aeribacillus pallidus]